MSLGPYHVRKSVPKDLQTADHPKLHRVWFASLVEGFTRVFASQAYAASWTLVSADIAGGCMKRRWWQPVPPNGPRMWGRF